MNLPTKITAARLALIPVFAVLYLVNFPFHMVAATAVFAVAALTDWLDGHLARKLNQVTDLGKFLDPIADKVLVCSALLLIAIAPTTPPIYQTLVVVFSLVIIARELIITCFRTLAASKNVILAADKLGKLKTVTQLIGLIFYLPWIEIAERNPATGNAFFYIGFAFLALATVLALASAANYIIKNRAVLAGGSGSKGE